MGEKRNILSLEERLERASKSQASSPAAAAAKVKKIADIHAARVFNGSSDIDLMVEFLPDFFDILPEDADVGHYCQFCIGYRIILDRVMHDRPCDDYSVLPRWGTGMTNAMVLQAMMFSELARDDKKRNGLSPFMKLTLDDYLGALVDLSFLENGELDEARAEEYRELRQYFRKKYKGLSSKPLGEAISGVLERCRSDMDTFDKLYDIIMCARKKVVAQKSGRLCGKLQYISPKEYKNNGKNRIFLKICDYRPESVWELVAWAADPALGERLKAMGDRSDWVLSMKRIDDVVEDIYRLLVQPYLEIENYHYEKHLNEPQM